MMKCMCSSLDTDGSGGGLYKRKVADTIDSHIACWHMLIVEEKISDGHKVIEYESALKGNIGKEHDDS